MTVRKAGKHNSQRLKLNSANLLILISLLAFQQSQDQLMTYLSIHNVLEGMGGVSLLWALSNNGRLGLKQTFLLLIYLK